MASQTVRCPREMQERLKVQKRHEDTEKIVKSRSEPFCHEGKAMFVMQANEVDK